MSIHNWFDELWPYKDETKLDRAPQTIISKYL